MEMRLSHHRSFASLDQFTSALFTTKEEVSTHSERGVGHSSHRGRGQVVGPLEVA